MKHFGKVFTGILLGAVLLQQFAQPVTLLAQETAQKEVDIVFTHDTHSHLSSYRDGVRGRSQRAGRLRET